MTTSFEFPVPRKHLFTIYERFGIARKSGRNVSSVMHACMLCQIINQQECAY